SGGVAPAGPARAPERAAASATAPAAAAMRRMRIPPAARGNPIEATHARPAQAAPATCGALGHNGSGRGQGASLRSARRLTAVRGAASFVQKERSMRPIQTILAAVDFSPHSEIVLDATVTLAKRFGAKVRLPPPSDTPIPRVSPYGVGIPEPYLEETRRVAAEKLATLVDRVAAQGVAVDSVLTEVPAASAIVRAAEEAKADLLV